MAGIELPPVITTCHLAHTQLPMLDDPSTVPVESVDSPCVVDVVEPLEGGVQCAAAPTAGPTSTPRATTS